LQALRDGRARVCVATDVAARGLDLPDLGLVIQAEAPRDSQALLHRSGRTGRAGRKGICVLLVPHSRRRGAERLFANANVRAEWSPPPPADKIRLKDQERLLKEVAQADDPSEEDLTAANALLAERTPAELAAALVRMYRARLPAPEELSETYAPPPRMARTDDAPETYRDRSSERRPERSQERRQEEPMGRDGAVVFRMNIGRNANADPRWMIPVICRRGGITKNEIGAIRILDNETQFEIVGHAAERFVAEARKPDTKDPNIRFATLNENVTPVADREMLVDAPARKYDEKRPFHKKPRDAAPAAKPAYKGKSDFKTKSDFKQKGEFKPGGEFKPKGEFKAKADFKPRSEVKPEARPKLFLKAGAGGDRPLIKKKRERPGRP
jgi:ATP-dependent RNA helicase DeaD